jgi:hypothetical protein
VIKISSKIRRVASALVIGVGGMILFSSCSTLSQFRSLPDEERYQYINQVKEDLDYKSAGEVIKEEYDNNDGIVSPSVFLADLKGEKTFTTLSDRLQALPEVKCDAASDRQTICHIGQADITITKIDESNNLVNLKILDSYSGR